ncbi:MAG TPA: hypothetical protein DCZ95_16010 [Verrucomicrobia bacterium]|nr:MAG: hypothetical protein A2X46_06745 [Lentisphaerae bacterium GWF2_57_35]HBA85588.1 hypothetical protein [Verrucomicrobiota bacterium]
MKLKNLLILTAAALCLGLAAYWTTLQKKQARVPSEGRMGALLLPKLADPDVLNGIEKIVVDNGLSTVTVAKADGFWVSPAKDDYPANFDRIREFLQGLSELKIGQTVTANAETMKRMGLLPAAAAEPNDGEVQGLLVTLWNGAGQPVESLRIGKEHRRNAPMEAEGMMTMGAPMGFADGRYVAVDGKGYLVTETFADLPREALGWLDQTLLNVDPAEIVQLSVSNRQNGLIQLARRGAESVFSVEGLQDDEQTQTGPVAELTALFSRLSFIDVLGEPAPGEGPGFDKATTITARTKDGEIYTLQIGDRPEGSPDRYARVVVSLDADSIAKSTNTVSEADAASLQKEVDRYNEKLSKWTYVIPSYRINGLLDGREKFVAKKASPDPAPAAPAP